MSRASDTTYDRAHAYAQRDADVRMLALALREDAHLASSWAHRVDVDGDNVIQPATRAAQDARMVTTTAQELLDAIDERHNARDRLAQAYALTWADAGQDAADAIADAGGGGGRAVRSVMGTVQDAIRRLLETADTVTSYRAIADAAMLRSLGTSGARRTIAARRLAADALERLRAAVHNADDVLAGADTVDAIAARYGHLALVHEVRS